MSKESAELLARLQEAWEEAQHQLSELKKQVQERTTLEKFLSEKEQAEQRRLKALSDLGMALYEEIQRGTMVPQKRWEALLQRVSDTLKKGREQQQKLSELLDEGQALVDQTNRPIKRL